MHGLLMAMLVSEDCSLMVQSQTWLVQEAYIGVGELVPLQ